MVGAAAALGLALTAGCGGSLAEEITSGEGPSAGAETTGWACTNAGASFDEKFDESLRWVYALDDGYAVLNAHRNAGVTHFWRIAAWGGESLGWPTVEQVHGAVAEAIPILDLDPVPAADELLPPDSGPGPIGPIDLGGFVVGGSVSEPSSQHDRTVVTLTGWDDYGSDYAAPLDYYPNLAYVAQNADTTTDFGECTYTPPLGDDQTDFARVHCIATDGAGQLRLRLTAAGHLVDVDWQVGAADGTATPDPVQVWTDLLDAARPGFGDGLTDLLVQVLEATEVRQTRVVSIGDLAVYLGFGDGDEVLAATGWPSR